MKPIVVPVDFSTVSANAAEYATKLAAQLNTEVILMHVYHVPAQVANVPFVTAPEQWLHDEAAERLKRFSEKLSQRGLSLKTVVKPGVITDNIIEVAKAHNAGLIVMGISGTGALKEFFIGSNAVDTAKHAPVPVLIVPAGSVFSGINRIAFASDLSPGRASDLTAIEEIVRNFNACIDMVKVVKPGESTDILRDIANRMEANGYFRSCSHSTHFIYSKDIIKGLNEFAESRKADIIAVMPHHHNLFARIFQPSTTKRAAFHTHVPLLSVPAAETETEDADLNSIARSLENGLDDQLREAIG